MGNIVSNFFISLDRVVDSHDQWHSPHWNDEMGTAIGKGVERTDAFRHGPPALGDQGQHHGDIWRRQRRPPLSIDATCMPTRRPLVPPPVGRTLSDPVNHEGETKR
jgi:hypothetical protein